MWPSRQGVVWSWPTRRHQHPGREIRSRGDKSSFGDPGSHPRSQRWHPGAKMEAPKPAQRKTWPVGHGPYSAGKMSSHQSQFGQPGRQEAGEAGGGGDRRMSLGPNWKLRAKGAVGEVLPNECLSPGSSESPSHPPRKGGAATEPEGGAETDLHWGRACGRAGKRRQCRQMACWRGAGALCLARSTLENEPGKKLPLVFVTAISAKH